MVWRWVIRAVVAGVLTVNILPAVAAEKSALAKFRGAQAASGVEAEPRVEQGTERRERSSYSRRRSGGRLWVTGAVLAVMGGGWVFRAVRSHLAKRGARGGAAYGAPVPSVGVQPSPDVQFSQALQPPPAVQPPPVPRQPPPIPPGAS